MRISFLFKFLLLFVVTVFLLISLSAVTEEVIASTSEEDDVWETVPLLFNGSFEPIEKDTQQDTSPLAEWRYFPKISDNKISLDSEKYLSGKSSLRVDGEKIINVVNKNIPIPAGMISVTGSIFYLGTFPSKVTIEFLKEEEVLQKRELRLIENEHSEWKRFSLSETPIPSGASAIRLFLITEFDTKGSVWWDEAHFTGVVEQAKTVDIFVNQVGYDLLYPKTCVLATNFKPEEMKSYLLGDSDREVIEIKFDDAMRIFGAHKSDWGKWFYRGDFTDWNEEGSYRIVVIIDKKKYYSPPFLIGKDLLWEKTIPKVLEGIRIHRCGTKVEGIHEPCHLDDVFETIPLTKGWHDGETYSKTKSALCLNLLAESYNICMWRLLKDNDLATKMREEVEWGAEYIANRTKEDGSLIGNVVSKPESETKKPEEETDNQQNTGDERTIQQEVSDEESVIGGLGNSAYLFSKIKPENSYITKTEILTRSGLQQGKKSAGLFTALVYLEEIKSTGEYISSLKSIIPDNIIFSSEVIPRYDSFTYENKTYDLVQALKDGLQLYSEQANRNPFGICPMKWTPEVDFFGTTAKTDGNVKGNNLHLLQIAQLAGKAFRFMPEDMAKKLFFDHINWILGVNPYGVCFIEGLGTKNVPVYAHPYVNSGIDSRKLVGVIPHGIHANSPTHDTPYLDAFSSSNPNINSAGISIETMALYINALAQFYRVRVHAETPTTPPPL